MTAIDHDLQEAKARKRLGDLLFVTDNQLRQRLGLPDNTTGRTKLQALVRLPGFPKPDSLMGQKYYMPAVQRFLDLRYELKVDAPKAAHGGRR